MKSLQIIRFAGYLLDRTGELQTIISYEADTTEALQKLRQLLAS